MYVGGVLRLLNLSSQKARTIGALTIRIGFGNYTKEPPKTLF